MDDPVLGLAALEALFLVMKVWALVNAVRRPGWAWERARESKTLWLVLLVIGLFLPCIGFLLALWYLFSTDRAVRAQQHLGPGIGFPGAMP